MCYLNAFSYSRLDAFESPSRLLCFTHEESREPQRENFELSVVLENLEIKK